MIRSKFQYIYTIMAMVSVAFLVLSFSSAPPTGRTNAPGDGNCTDCHSNGNLNGNITLTGLPATVDPNTTYPLTLTLTKTAGNALRAGFQVTMRDDGNNAMFVGAFGNAGSFAAIQGTEYVGHSPAEAFSGNTIDYTFDWTSPASITGSGVSLYTAALFANNMGNYPNGGGGNTGGDFTANSVFTANWNAGNPALMASITNQSPAQCNGESNGSATVSATGGTGTYSYLWSNNETTATATALAAGNQSVTVTSGSEQVVIPVNITQPSAITISLISQQNIDCINTTGSATVVATGGNGNFQYSWSSGATGQTANNLVAGTYTVTAFDASQCSEIFTVNITADDTPPDAIAGNGGQLDCNTTTVQLNGQGSATGGNISYQWTTQDGNIMFGGTSLTPTVNAAGTYTLTVTNSTNGCTNTAQTTVTEDTTPPTAEAGPTMEITCTQSTVTLDASGSSIGNFTYQWMTANGNILSGATTLNPTVDAPGSYTLTITSFANGCQSFDAVTVTGSTNTPTANATSLAACGDANGQATFDLTSLNSTVNGNTGLNVNWYFDQATNNPIPNPQAFTSSSTIVFATVNDGNCLSTPASIDLTALSAPFASGTSAEECGDGQVVFNLTNLENTVNGGSNNAVNWYFDAAANNAINNPQTFITSSTTVFAVVTNNTTGCTSDALTINLTVNPQPTANAGADMQLTCDNPTVTLDGTASSQSGNFVYEWTTTDGNIISGGLTLTPTVNATGTYTLLITDPNTGCQNNDSAIVTGNSDIPDAIIAPANELNCNVLAITLDGSASSSGNDISYEWTTQDGNITGNTDQNTATATSAGIYTLTVSNTTTGCFAQANIEIVDNVEVPITDAGPAQTLTCSNNSVTLDGSASSTGNEFNYEWMDANGDVISTAITVTVSVAGTYTLTVTNTTNGCISNDFVEVFENAQAPIADAGADMVVVGMNTTAVLDGTNSSQGAEIVYQWTTQDGTILSDSNTLNPTVDGAGTYCLEVLNTNNGCNAIDCMTITAEDCEAPVIELIILSEIACNGDETASLEVQIDGGFTNETIDWSNGANTAIIDGLPAGEYLVVVTNDCGASSIITTVISELPDLELSVETTNESAAGASDGSATANVSGGTGNYTYLWSNSTTTQMISNLPAGEYCVTVTDGNGCEVESCGTVNSFDCDLTAEISATNILCNGEVGSATVTAMNGTMPYSYAWSSGGDEATETGLVAGTYTVTTSDAANCEVILTVTIDEPTAMLITTDVVQVLCNGDATGSATAFVTGGTPPYQYDWSAGSGDNLPAGIYTVTAIDANQCTITAEFEILEPTAITMTTTVTDASAMGATDGSISIGAMGGTTPYQYSIDACITFQPTGEFTNLAAGTYNAAVVDANGCKVEESLVINEMGDACAGFTMTLTSQNPSCNGFTNGSASIEITGGTAPFTIAWSSGGDEMTETGLSAGMYSLMVTDANDCVLSESFELVEPSALTIQIVEQNNIECAGQTSGSVTVMGAGGTPIVNDGYLYSWSTGESGATQTDLAAGTYTVSVYDAFQCETILDIEITAGGDITPPNVVTQNVTVNLDADGQAIISAEQIDGTSTDNCGVATLTIDMMNFSCQNLGDNTVILTVTDVNDNMNTGEATVTVVDAIAPAVDCPPNQSFAACGPQEIIYILNVFDNCGDFTQELISGLGSGGTFPVGTTTESYIVTDASGNTTECSFDITIEGSDMQLSLQGTDPSCPGDSDGSIVVAVAGGTPPYVYTWTGGGGEDLPAGVYEVMVEDANACQINGSVTLVDPPAIEIETGQIVNENNNNFDGAIAVDISGGTGDLTISWAGPNGFTSDQEDLQNIEAGDYILTVIDENACEMSITVVVERITATEEPEWAQDLMLLPNPTNGRLQVTFSSNINTDMQVIVYDLVGKQMLTQTATNNRFELDLRPFASGVYLVKIQTETGAAVRKIVKE